MNYTVYELNVVLDSRSVIAYNTLSWPNIFLITSHYAAPYNLTIKNTVSSHTKGIYGGGLYIDGA